MHATKNCYHLNLKSIFAYFRSSSGNVAIIFSLAAAGLLAAAGVAIDSAKTFDRQTTAQALIDAATLAGIATVGSDETRISAAKLNFAKNKDSEEFETSGLTFEFSEKSKQLRGSVSIKSSNLFMSIFAIKETEIKVDSTAVYDGIPAAFCVHALNSSQSSALIFNNKRGPLTYAGSAIVAPDCSVQVNSSSSSALLVKEANDYNFQKFCIVGSVAGNIASLIPSPDSTCKKSIPDPFASTAFPNASGACASKSFSSSGSNVTVSPGNYCGGLSVSGTNIVFNPGIYTIADSDLTLNASNGISADGVTFVMGTGSGKISIQSGGLMSLKAPTSGVTANFLIIDKSGTNTNHIIKTTVRDASWMKLDGIIYTPKDHFEVWWQRGGVGASEKPLKWTNFGLIADTIDMHGYNQLFIEAAKSLALTSGGTTTNVSDGTARLIQ